MHTSKLPAIAAAAAICIPAQKILAHHSYTMFDLQKNVTLEGTVKELQWTNPHIWLQLLVKDPATGKEVEWSIEGASPNMLSRAGWTRRAVSVGDQAVIVVHPAHSSPNMGSLAILTINGKRIFGTQGAAGAQPAAQTPNQSAEGK